MAADLRGLFESQKELAVKPHWVATDSTWFNLAAPLDIGGATVEGLELRAGAVQSLPDRAVRFHLQYHPARGPCNPLCRVEWRPLSPHTNPNKGPKSLQLRKIKGTHVHGFEMNFLDAEGRMLSGNLPIAEIINPEPNSFQELLAVVGKRLRINDMDQIEPPPWREADLFGV